MSNIVQALELSILGNGTQNDIEHSKNLLSEKQTSNSHSFNTNIHMRYRYQNRRFAKMSAFTENLADTDRRQISRYRYRHFGQNVGRYKY